MVMRQFQISASALMRTAAHGARAPVSARSCLPAMASLHNTATVNDKRRSRRRSVWKQSLERKTQAPAAVDSGHLVDVR
jgi:hypothetical protein